MHGESPDQFTHGPSEHALQNRIGGSCRSTAPQRVLLIVDKYGWSYHTIAQGLVEHQHDERLHLDVASIQEDLDFIERRHGDYDLIFPLGWTLVLSKKKKDRYRPLLPFIDPSRIITGIHSHRAWDDYASLPDSCPPPPDHLIDALSAFRGVNAISQRLYRLFRQAGLANLALTENGVDTDVFFPRKPITIDRAKPLTIGFSGSTSVAKHDALKGLSEYILPLREIPNVHVKVLGGRGENQVPRNAMPDLYNTIDLYICASTSEGFSQSVLEASACGRGVLSTRVGGCEDLIEEGRNGFFIDRDVAAIKTLITRLEADRRLVQRLGRDNRQVILERFSWSLKGREWWNFIGSHLPQRIRPLREPSVVERRPVL